MKISSKYQTGFSQGAATLISILIITTVILTISLSLGISALNESQSSFYHSYFGRMFLNTDGCAEEALTKMDRNNSYTGETLVINNTSCVITVSGSGKLRTLLVTATNTDFTRKIQIDVNIFPTVTITAWQELTT
jgi:hypothetical protein